ncbi:MAG: YcxB family protein [Cytophagales bacterium]
MIIQTKKYALPKKTYIKIGFFNALRLQWWGSLLFMVTIPLLFFTGYIKTGVLFCFLFLGYLGFWWVQFYAVTRMEQGKMMFNPFVYVISSKEIMMRMTSKQGMPLSWDQIKRVKRRKKAFLFEINKAQFILLPYRIFKTPQHIKFVNHLLRRKKLL